MRRTAAAQCAWRRTRAVRNFFPMGMTSGPKNRHVFAAHNNLDGAATNNMPKLRGALDQHPGLVRRDELKLRCEHCRFEWVYDTLVVRCAAHPEEHNRREVWLHPTWMWGKQQPYKYYHYMPPATNPRTLAYMPHEDAKRMNNERRSQGLTTARRRLEMERRGISRAVSGIGSFAQRWQTRFPFAC